VWSAFLALWPLAHGHELKQAFDGFFLALVLALTHGLLSPGDPYVLIERRNALPTRDTIDVCSCRDPPAGAAGAPSVLFPSPSSSR